MAPGRGDYRADRSLRESDLASFYEQQAADRAGFPTPVVRDQHLAAFLDRLAAVVDDPHHARVLEVGSGSGRDAAALAGRGFWVTAIDLAIANLNHTRSSAEVAKASAVELPFAARCFDAVVSMSTLMHISDDDVHLALQECKRVLRPGGLAAFGTWGGENADKVVDNDHYDPPRYFALRTDATWRAMVAEHASVIELTTWRVADLTDHYQWVVARFDRSS